MTNTYAKKIAGLFLLLTVFFANVSAQEMESKGVAEVHEKIYIHFDKPYYNSGETAWFKVYLYNNGLPSSLSNELFLQLQDDAGNLVLQKRYPITGSTCTGSIALNDTILQGFYSIRAITKTIAANEPEFFYSKSFFIYNANRQQKDTLVKNDVFIRFFPEGGHLVDRIRTQVAFKVTDYKGSPLMLSGSIKSDSITVIAAFKTFHDGIGKTSFTPRLADSLFAEALYNGKLYRFALPRIMPSGVSLKISDADSGKLFEITRSKQDIDFYDTVRLLVKLNNDTIFENTIAFGNAQTLNGFLKTDHIPSGILHFLLLNKDGIPLSERLSFQNNREYLSQPELLVIKRDKGKRGVSIFELKFADSIQRSFSISATVLAARDFPDKENICSRFLLSSDLKGYVYNPAYYFEKDDDSTRIALDNLMLTHGWSRYNWNKREQIKPITNYEYLISISGTVKESRNGKAVSAGSLALQIMAADSTIQFVEAGVDENGRFMLDSMLFSGNARIYYTFVSASGKTIPVELMVDPDSGENLYALISKKIHSPGFQQLNEKIEFQAAGSFTQPVFETKFKELSTIFLKTKIKRPEDKINEKYASPTFRSSGKLVLDNINRPYNNRSLSVINYALTNLSNLAYDPSYDALVNKKNFSLQSQKNWIVEVLIDEQAVTLPIASSIMMDRVALIKFYEAGFVGVGTQAPGGALAIYLKKFDDIQPYKEAGVKNSIFYQGYDVVKEFYKPDYNLPIKSNSTIDNRITLYWDPVIKSGKVSETVQFGFYNNDISKKISIIIEGFDERGKLIKYSAVFE